MDEFFRFMQAANYYFKVSRDLWHLYITDSHYGSLGFDGSNDWEILQGRYILCLLFEYAATLGMIDVTYDSPAQRASFTVMPSLWLIVSGELSPDEENMPESFTDRSAETEWQFSVIRTLKTIEAGHDVRVLSDFLQERDEQPLLDTVAAFFRDALARARAIRDRGEAKIIECTDAVLAERLAILSF